MGENDAMDDEFDTVASWTADAALELGTDHAVPAGCKGSGGPAALDWLLDRLQVTDADRMLDCGAGVGGPAAYAARATGARTVLAEPEPGACHAAERLFGLPTTVAEAQRLSFGDAAFDVAWSLAVLCTTDDKAEVLDELHRVLVKHGRLGLLVYVRTSDDLSGGPDGNVFPSDDELTDLLDAADFEVTARHDVADLPGDPDDWTRRADAVADLMQRRHADDEAWQTAQRQSEAFGRLLADGRVVGRLLALRSL